MACDTEKYEDTVTYLYSLQKHGIKLGLSNTKELMRILGEPQNRFHCIQIAGTNGKGSTASMIASILKESGFKTGLFTSPHLISFTERIRVNNDQISESDVIDLASRIRNLIADTELNPTFFEFVTAMAFHHFARTSVDWAVIETGMGGRLDATNVVHPEITIITNISLDHCEFLGSTIAEIASEKAGIIKQGVPLITASDNPDVIEQLSGIAEKLHADIHVYGNGFNGHLKEMDSRHITFNYEGDRRHDNLSVPLSGKYQLVNACLAVKACELLNSQGVSIPDSSIRQGLESITIEGRLELVSHSPLIILDGAHNPDASGALAESVKELFPEKNIILIAGVMNDKNINDIMAPLMEIAESVILTRARYERAASPEKMLDIIRSLKKGERQHIPASITATASVSEALDLARSQYTENSIILVTGSFYTTGEAKEVLGHRAILSELRE